MKSNKASAIEEKVELQRDKCPACIALKGNLTANGAQKYCSQAHAYELSNIHKSDHTENLKKEIFDMVYQWGKNNVVVDDNALAYRQLVDELEDTWY